MTVPEALEQLEYLLDEGSPSWHKKAENILDAVWLQAYKEGEAQVFTAKKRLIDEQGNDLGEITGMIWHDGSVHGDPENWNVYKVRVKRES